MKKNNQTTTTQLLYSEQAERNLVIAFLTLPDAVVESSALITPEEFYLVPYQYLAQACFDLFSKGKAINLVSVEQTLQKNKQLDEVGKHNLDLLCADIVQGTIEQLCEIVRDFAQRRKTIQIAQQLIQQASDMAKVPSEAINIASIQLLDVTNTKQNKILTMGEARDSLLQKVIKDREAHKIGEATSFLLTKFTDLDRKIRFTNGDLILIAARPGMGKSAFVVSLAAHFGLQGKKGALFMLEMSIDETVGRLIAHQSTNELKYADIKKPDYLKDEDINEIAQAGSYIEDKIYIDDSASLSIEELRTKAIKLKIQENIEFLAIDYIQLMHAKGLRNSANREQEISTIARGLKNLAKELDIPVLALSQLSREVERRSDKRPLLSDLRESGCLTGDTLITNAETGERKTIKELAERKEQIPIPIFATNNSFKVGVHQMSKVFYSGKKQVYELKTQTGRIIKASANHPFLKIEGWERLENLKIGDKIGVIQENKDKSISSIIYWDTIVSITPLGIEDVYDATVPTVSNFTANGIIVHNSLEQDANAVIFLYRPEYYGISVDASGESCVGVTEAIISKNRAGSTGVVKLDSNKLPQSRFEDYYVHNTHQQPNF